MKWRSILIGLFVLLLIIPTLLYVGSLDWSRQHSARVAALPLLDTATANTGTYRLRAGQYEYLVRVAGLQNDGPNLLLLHGFPESSVMWTALLKQAADAGFRVLAFDQRGYSPGARPANVADYQLDQLQADVLTIASQVGFKTFHLVGHDWGAVVGWGVTASHPERVRSWSALSIPHTGTFLAGIVHDTVQQKRSSYIALFKRPYLPEWLLTYGGQRSLKKLLATLPPDHRADYLAIQAEPGALTAALNWYRALNIEQLASATTLNVPVSRPTLFIWGTTDVTVSPTIVARQRPFIKGPYREYALKAGHALIQEKEKEVIEAILTHIQAN